MLRNLCKLIIIVLLLTSSIFVLSSCSKDEEVLQKTGTQLEAIDKDNNLSDETNVDNDSEAHTIPLIETRWGQEGTYAKYTPDNNLLGCWSTAISQILYYHRKKPSGSVEYTTSTGYLIKENMDDYKFDWELFFNKDSKDISEESKEQVGKYVYYTAATIGKDFGNGTYIYDAEKMIQEIYEHYGCKAEWYGRDLPRSKIKEVIAEELDNGRPVMLYMEWNGGGHAVVVDSYKISKFNEFWMHINMGYEGKYDGSYTIDNQIMKNYDTMDIREVMTIKP